MRTLAAILLLSSFSFAQGGGGKVGFGGKAGFGGGLPATGPSLVTACGNNTSSAVASVTVSCTVPAGDEVVLFGGYNSAATVACSDSAGDTFTTPAHSTSGSNSTFVCQALSSPGGATSVTATFTGSTTICTCSVAVLSGVTTNDVAASFVTTAAGTSYAWNTITTSNAVDIVLAFGSNASVNNTYTAGAPYAIPTGVCATTGVCGQMSGGAQSAMLESFVTSSSGNQSPTATGTGSLALSTVVLSFH